MKANTAKSLTWMLNFTLHEEALSSVSTLYPNGLRVVAAAAHGTMSVYYSLKNLFLIFVWSVFNICSVLSPTSILAMSSISQTLHRDHV